MSKISHIVRLPLRLVDTIRFRKPSSSQKYDLSVVCIIKNEGRYIEEWIQFHKLVGVQHFYIYDNDSDDNTKELLTPWIENGDITYTFWPGKGRQLDAYNDTLRRYRNDSKYLAVIDADEFLMPINKVDIKERLDEIISSNSHAGGVAINWCMFGSSGLIARPEMGGGTAELLISSRSWKNWDWRDKNCLYA